MWVSSEDLHIRLTTELLEQIDRAARASYQSRSSYIRESIALRLNQQHIVKEPTEDEFIKNLERFSQQDAEDVLDV